MLINNVPFNADLTNIIIELQTQLSLNNIPLLQKTKETRNDIMVCCPYHKNGQERKPSAGIRKTDGQFHCFTCGETHSLQEVISHCFGYVDDIMGAFGWQWLLKNFVSINVEERKDVELDFSRTNITRIRNNNASDAIGGSSVHKVNTQYISEQELDSYRYIHPYMYKRRLTDEIIELFDIGYDKNTQCITFPVRDINGNTLFIARRSVKTKFFNYPQGVEKPLYGLYELTTLAHTKLKECAVTDLSRWQIDELIVCESMLDALTAWVYGKYAVALNGLGNELQFQQLRDLPCRKLILATDSDEAGMKARARIRKNVPNKIITEYILPAGKKDLNDLEMSEFIGLEEVF